MVWSGGGPACGVVAGQAEDRQAGEVCCGGQEFEVGGDLFEAAHAGSSAAVSASGQVGDFAFDFGSSGAVVGLPGGVVLGVTTCGQTFLVVTDGDPEGNLGEPRTGFAF